MPGKQNRVAVMSVITLLTVAGLSRRSWEQPPTLPGSLGCKDDYCVSLKGQDHPIPTFPEDLGAARVPWNTAVLLTVSRGAQTMGVSSAQISIAVYEVQSGSARLNVGRHSESVARSNSAVKLETPPPASTPPVLQAASTALLSYAPLGLKDQPRRIAFNLAAKPQQFTLRLNPPAGTHLYLLVVSGKNASNANAQTARMFITRK